MTDRTTAGSDGEDSVQEPAIAYRQAIRRAQAFIDRGNVLRVFGDSAGAAAYYSLARGVLQSAGA